ncbi:MAG: phage portal protein [Janthinobacterium lividum]
MPALDGEILPPERAPALVEAAHPLDAMFGFTDGQDGTRMSWAKYRTANPFGAGSGFASGGYAAGSGYMDAARNPQNREHAVAAEVALDLLTSNPSLATLAENLATQAVGDGLIYSPRLDSEALGMTPEEAREVGQQIQRGFAAWCNNSRECDLRGLHTVHQIAHAGFTSYLLTGELVATVEFGRFRNAKSTTKVCLRPSNQIDRTRNESVNGQTTFMGVSFDARGRCIGYYLREAVTPRQYPQAQPTFVPVYTPWGRPKVIHLFDLKLAAQVRGLSPLVAALTPAHEKNTLQESVLAATMLGSNFAMTVESEGGAANAFRSLDGGQDPAQVFSQFLDTRAQWYGKQKIDARVGTINHLPPGDKLKFNQAQAPTGTYHEFDRTLGRTTAKAAGSSYEDLSGDYSQTSFSASRMATELPHRINLRRRANIAEAFYRTLLECWIEEACSVGWVKLPDHALPFYDARDLYTAGRFLGPPRVQPDPKKAAEADILEIENNLATLTEKLADRGHSFDDYVAQRKYEREALEAAGLPANEPGAVTTQNKRTEVLPPEERDED